MSIRGWRDRGAWRGAGCGLLAVLVAACGSKSVPDTGGTKAGPGAGNPAELDGLIQPALAGWMGRYGRNPKDAGTLTGSSEGWNSLWEGNLPQAIEGFRSSLADAQPAEVFGHSVGLARAALEAGDYYRALDRATVELALQYLGERDQRRDKIGAVTPVESYYAAMLPLLRDGAAGATPAIGPLTALAARPDAGSFGPMAKAWLGLAHSLAGDAAAAQKSWQEAAAAAGADPNLALLIAYTQARAGQLQGETLPEGDGSSYARRLRISALLRTGQSEQGLREFKTLQFREPDHSVRLAAETAPTPAATAPTAGSAAAATAPAATAKGDPALGEERTNLEFFATYLLEEVARTHYLLAEKTLASDGPGGCAAYWRGRAAEARGDRTAALAAYQAVRGGGAGGAPAAAASNPTAPAAPAPAAAPGSAAAPATPGAAGPVAAGADDPVACLVLTSFGTVDALAEDARLRSAVLQGKLPEGPAPTSFVGRLALLEAKAQLDPKNAEILAGLAMLPEDPRVLEALLEPAFDKAVGEQGATGLLRGRFFEHYLHDLYLVKAHIATRVNEPRLAVKTLDAMHDNTQQDAFSTLNRPGFLLDSAMARWRAKDPQGTGVLLNVLWKQLPEVWPSSEYVRRIRAFHALDNIKSDDVTGGI